MPKNENDIFDFDIIIEACKNLVSQLMMGDLALRQASLSKDGILRWLPAILVARQLAGKLKFYMQFEKKKNVFFGLLGKKTDHAAAFLRINLGLEPVPGSSNLFSRPAKLTWLSPAFLELDRMPDAVGLRLADQRRLRVRLGSDLKPERIEIDGRSQDPAEVDFQLAGAILDTIGGWQRALKLGQRTQITIPAADNTSAQGVLSKINTGFEEIYETLLLPFYDTDIGSLHRYWSYIHPDLGATYQFQNSYARLLTHINGRGEIVKPDELFEDPHLKETGCQQVDIESRILQNLKETELCLTLRLPDILIKGRRYHRRFVDALGRVSVREEIIAHLQDGPFPKASLVRLIKDKSTEDNIIFARTDHKSSEKSWDLVLIKGRVDDQPVTCLFEMRFKVSGYPEVKVKSVKNVKLLYSSFMREAPQINSDVQRRIRRYLAGLFHILLYWKLRTV